METSFTTFLADAWGVSREEAERSLERVGETIRARLEQHGAIDIVGLGTFRQLGDSIVFDADDELAGAVNIEYAGLSVLDLGPAATAETKDAEVGSGDGRDPDPFAYVTPSGTHGEPPPESKTVDAYRDDVDALAEPLRDLNSDVQLHPAEPDPVPERDGPESPDFEHEVVPPLEADFPYAEPTEEEGTLNQEDSDDTVLLEQGEGGAIAPAPDDADDESPSLTEDLDGLAGSDDVEDDVDALIEGVWTPAFRDQGQDHPLGPPPPDPYEDADFQLVDQADEPHRGDHDTAPSGEQPVTEHPDGEATDERYDEAGEAGDEDLGAGLASTQADAHDEAPSTEQRTPLAEEPDVEDHEVGTHEDGADDNDELSPGPPAAVDEPEAELSDHRTPTPPPFAATRPPAAPLAAADDRAKPSMPPPRRAAAPEAPADDAPPSGTRAGLLPVAIIAGLVIAATGGLAYWVLWGQPGAPDPTAEVAPAPRADEPEPTPPPDEPAPAEEEPPAQPVDDRLYSSERVEPARGGFTWVVSEPSAADAERRAERYRAQGYRVAVLPAVVRGTTYYRVAIGQFESRAAAEEHRDELPGDVPPDVWPLAL